MNVNCYKTGCFNYVFFRYSGEFHDFGVKLDLLADKLWDYVSDFILLINLV